MAQTAEALMEGMSNKPSSFTSATHAEHVRGMFKVWRCGGVEECEGVDWERCDGGVWTSFLAITLFSPPSFPPLSLSPPSLLPRSPRFHGLRFLQHSVLLSGTQMTQRWWRCVSMPSAAPSV